MRKGDFMPYSGRATGEFCWNRLMTRDLNEAKKFYCKLFGWELHKANLGDLPIFVFKKADKEIGGLMETPIGLEETFAPHWMSYIAVEDINLSVAKAVELGASVILPVKSIGTSGYVSIITDPVGARIGLWQASTEMY